MESVKRHGQPRPRFNHSIRPGQRAKYDRFLRAVSPALPLGWIVQDPQAYRPRDERNASKKLARTPGQK